MRYLRMFSNAVIGGAFGALFVTILVLQLNPHLSLSPVTVLPLYGRLALFYAVHLAVAFYAALVIWQLFGSTAHSPGWISLRLQSWFGTLIVASAGLLMWFNVSGFHVVLEDDLVRRIGAGAGATMVCALLLAVITFVHYSFGRRGSRVGGTLLVLTLLASVLFPLTARGLGQQRPLVARAIDLGVGEPAEADGPRLVLLALDGASLDYISLEVADGRLPNFGRILTAGAALHLATIRPTQPTTVWAAALTGKYPPKNGVRSAAAYSFAANQPPIELLPDLVFAHALVRLGILREVSYTPASLRARPVWSILSNQRVPVGIVGWELSDPDEPLRGFLLSDRFARALRSPLEFADDQLGYPPQAVRTARLNEQATADRLAGTPLDRPPLASDAVSSEIAARLRTEYQPRLVAVRYQGLDRAGHQFLRYALPRAFGDVSEQELQRYGGVLDEHYAYIDAEVGQAIASLRPEDVLLVVSGFGMQPISLGKRLIARAMGDADVTGSHERAPDGFLLAYGESIKPGRAPLGSVVDLAPTMLYFLGLPVGRDMDGYARTDLFKPAFTAARPITAIPTYER